MIRLAAYLGIGVFGHLVFIGSHFDFTSAWTWLWLLAWPPMLVSAVGVAGIIVAAIIIAVVGVQEVFRS